MSTAAASFLSSYQALQGRQDWLASLRKEGFERFEAKGLPTLKDEEWHYTNLAPISALGFGPAVSKASTSASLALVEQAAPGSAGARLVFVDGHLVPGLSSTEALPKGARLVPLSVATAKERQLVEPFLGRTGITERALSALNTALMEDGAVLHLARGVVVEQPIHFIFLSSSAKGPVASHPRNLVIAEPEASATIVESYEGQGTSPYLTNAVTEVLLEPNAQLRHIKVQLEAEGAFHVSVLQARQERGSRLSSHVIQLGGALARSETRVVLAGPGAECSLDGLILGGGSQHLDALTHVDHAAPNCTSRQLYKEVLADRARGVFFGRVLVRPEAQKTDAVQTNRNLLLSENAHVDTRPQLEILADDVKCAHGAAVGQLDEAAVFYLRARGIPLAMAQSVLTYAFAAELVGRLPVESVRTRVQKLVISRLPGAGALEGLA